MDSYHDIFLEWLNNITFTYNKRILLDLLTMDGYHSIFLQGIATIASTYIEWLP
jgi:hypothetical protein